MRNYPGAQAQAYLIIIIIISATVAPLRCRRYAFAEFDATNIVKTHSISI